jgi:hypothetical protein
MLFQEVRKNIFSYFLLLFILNSTICVSQTTMPEKNEIVSHNISEMIVNNYITINEKSKKEHIDTMMFNLSGNLVEKRITAYDTASERELSGIWTYTYDSLENHLLETRKSAKKHVMDYFVYVYDSSHIQRKIWNYWVNLRLLFNRIYDFKYDADGHVKLEIVEDGREQLDSIYSFKYDTKNRLIQLTCVRDKDFKDTLNTTDYFYNSVGALTKEIATGKTSKSIEEFTYNSLGKLTKQESDLETVAYQYSKNGLLAVSERTVKDKKGSKYKCTYTYLYR